MTGVTFVRVKPCGLDQGLSRFLRDIQSIFQCALANPPALRRRRVLGRWFSFFTMIICTASLRIEVRTARLFESSAVGKADGPMTFEARLTLSLSALRR